MKGRDQTFGEKERSVSCKPHTPHSRPTHIAAMTQWNPCGTRNQAPVRSSVRIELFAAVSVAAVVVLPVVRAVATYQPTQTAFVLRLRALRCGLRLHTKPPPPPPPNPRGSSAALGGAIHHAVARAARHDMGERAPPGARLRPPRQRAD